MDEPEIKTRVYFIPYPPESCYLIRAIVQAERKCTRCGYSWMFYGSSKLTEKEILDNHLSPINCRNVTESMHPFVEAKRNEARENALKFFNRPMNVCKMCHPEGTRMQKAHEEDSEKDD